MATPSSSIQSGEDRPSTTNLPTSSTDVLIIGAGPSGLMLSTWLSTLHIPHRVLDKRGTKVFAGQADGLQSRSLEIFDSFGFADRVWKESNHMLEFAMWNPATDASGASVLRRSDRVPDTPVGLSRFTEVVLTQGRIERFFLDHIAAHDGPGVERGALPESLSFDREQAEAPGDVYPISVTVRHLSDEEATPAQNLSSVSDGLFRSSLAPDDTEELLKKGRAKGEVGREVIKAKYLVGCDGAHSWTRRQLGAGFELEGEPTDFVWGVLDIIPITDFPDVRMRCAIHSAESGSMMIIPRERGLVRLYIQLTEVKPDETGRTDRSKITPDTILKAAQKIIKPYTLEYEYCEWYTGYQIGQRVGNKFSDLNRIFLAGDAVHTHSPKAGQGMNVSMQDTYNLGFKLGLVLRNLSPRSILSTYESERRSIAQQLIEFDHKFSRLFSGRPAKDAADEAGVSMEEFKAVYVKGHEFASGVSVEYGPSVFVAGVSNGGVANGNVRDGREGEVLAKQELARNLKLGKRYPSFQVLNQADARPWPFQHWLESDGRFYLILFAGNVVKAEQMKRVEKCCQSLEGVLHRYTPGGGKNNSVIQVLTLHSSPRTALDRGIFEFPELLRGPFDKRKGWDYNRIFVDDQSYHEGHGHAYEGYGVDEEKGCLVLCRPDQYVSWIGELEDVQEMDKFLSRILLVSSQGGKAMEHGTSIPAKTEAFKQVNEKQTEDLTAKPLDQAGGLAV